MNTFKDLQIDDFDKEFVFESVFSNISYAEKIMSIIEENKEISDEVYGNILLSISEAINNAIVHGNKFNKEKSVFVGIKFLDDALFIQVKDEGDGFDHTKIPDPTKEENIEKLYGRGVFIIISLSDKVEFEYDNGQIVRMFFQLQ